PPRSTPRPSYTPPRRPSYTPPRSTPRPSYTPPRSTPRPSYAPPRSTPRSTPRPSYTPPRTTPRPSSTPPQGSARVRRSSPGAAHGGQALPRVAGRRWLRGTHGNAGRIPGEVAEALRGRRFKNFDGLRRAIWKRIAADPELRKAFAFDDRNL